MNFEAIMEIAELISSFATPLVVAFFGYIISRKLDGLKTTSEWKKVWAEKFLQCSNTFSDSASKIVVNVSLWSETNKQQQENWEEIADIKHKEILKHLDQISLYDWELQNYVQFAKKNKDSFIDAEKNLHKLLAELIAYCKKPDGSHFDLEAIRTAQFEYNKTARDVHSELMGIKL